MSSGNLFKSDTSKRIIDFAEVPSNPASFWHVFRDDAEARAGFRQASFKVGFAGKLVFEHIQIRHAESVLARGFEESIVPLERREALRGAFAIEGFEKLAFGIVALELRIRAGGNKK